MSERDRHPRRSGFRGDTRLALIAVALLFAGGIVSAVELIGLGHLTAPVLALDLIGATMLPYGVLAMLLTSGRGRTEEDGEDEDSGGGWGEITLDPLPPSGGLQIDWRRFEADFAAYVRASAPAGASA